MQVDVLAISVGSLYPGCIAHVVFVIPIIHFDRAIPHQLIHLILIRHTPFPFPELIAHHVIFRAGDVAIDIGVGVTRIDICAGIISLLRSGYQGRHSAAAI